MKLVDLAKYPETGAIYGLIYVRYYDWSTVHPSSALNSFKKENQERKKIMRRGPRSTLT